MKDHFRWISFLTVKQYEEVNSVIGKMSKWAYYKLWVKKNLDNTEQGELLNSKIPSTFLSTNIGQIPLFLVCNVIVSDSVS